MVVRSAVIAGVLVACAVPVARCASGGASAGGQAATGAGTVQAFVGDERASAPTVSGELLDATWFDLVSLRQKVIVVNVWGSWCAPCRAEAPELQATYWATEDLEVAFLGVDIRDGRHAVGALATEERP